MDVMSAPLACTGTLLWYDVPFHDGPDGAVLECSDCGYLVVAGTPLDERHVESQVLRSGV